jgi:hypothetical protein
MYKQLSKHAERKILICMYKQLSGIVIKTTDREMAFSNHICMYKQLPKQSKPTFIICMYKQLSGIVIKTTDWKMAFSNFTQWSVSQESTQAHPDCLSFTQHVSGSYFGKCLQGLI